MVELYVLRPSDRGSIFSLQSSCRFNYVLNQTITLTSIKFIKLLNQNYYSMYSIFNVDKPTALFVQAHAEYGNQLLVAH